MLAQLVDDSFWGALLSRHVAYLSTILIPSIEDGLPAGEQVSFVMPGRTILSDVRARVVKLCASVPNQCAPSAQSLSR